MLIVFIGLVGGGFFGWKSYFHLAVGDYILLDYLLACVFTVMFSYLGCMVGKYISKILTTKFLSGRLMDLTGFDTTDEINLQPFLLEVNCDNNKGVKVISVELYLGRRKMLEIYPGSSFNFSIENEKNSDKNRCEVYMFVLTKLWQKLIFWIDKGENLKYFFFFSKTPIVKVSSLRH